MSISPADRQPEWWIDVDQSLSASIKAFQKVLEAIENALENSSSIEHLPSALGSVALRLSKSLTVAEQRLADAVAAGKPPVSLESCQNIVNHQLHRCILLSGRMKKRQDEIGQTLSQRRGRRPLNRNFRPPTPSHIDIRL